uniref:MazG-like pyrophosphatase n=1 Tax=Salmonella phage vB_STmST313_KE31 TaxID=3161181 RepID=A0AAU8GI77_9CAUD
MKFLHTIIGTSYDCTAHSPDRSPVFVHSKLVEEVSELSDVFNGIAASEPLNGEVADVIISAVDLLYVMDYNATQIHGCMTKEEMIDSFINRMEMVNDISSELLEENWFRLVDRTPDKNLAMVVHYIGRVTRLLNQPQRSHDILERIIAQLISHVARMACGQGVLHSDSLMSTRVKVEHAVEHKVEKWRTKFGL